MVSDGPVRIGVVGRGFGARVVAPVFQETDGCDVVDVVSPRDGDAVRTLCDRDDLDLVAVHSPPFLHTEHVLAAVARGHAVLCDKPFGRSAAHAATMLDAATAAGVVHLANLEFRFHPGRQALRDLVRDGAVGEVEHVQWTQWSAGSRFPLRRFGWLFDRALGGGWIGAWGSHALDFLRWTFGDLVDPSAQLRTAVRQRPDAEGQLHDCTAEDGFTATLASQTGVTMTIDSTFVAPVNVPGRVTVIGSRGVLESIGDHRITLRTERGSEEVFALDHAPGGDPHLLPMRRWAAVVRDAVRAGAAPADAATLDDGLACARVMDALRGE